MAKFDFVIGNPPYQEDRTIESEQKGYAAPVYHLFLDEASKVADRVLMIHPARFLFNAGSTPKPWNQKMLNNEHFKIVDYTADSKDYFTNVDIKGGVAISYQSSLDTYHPIEIFTPYPELNITLNRIRNDSDVIPLSSIILSRTSYRFTDKMHRDFPEARSQMTTGHAYDMATNIFEKLPQVFSSVEPISSKDSYISMLGLKNKKRIKLFIKKDYVIQVSNLHKYKVVMPSANGSGSFGEVITNPEIGFPEEGNTETFITLGAFDTIDEAQNALKYIKTKFARALFSVLKVTPNNTPEKWKYVPLQNFTNNSDIDWTKSISEIDQQLYKKYGLSPEEISFIENNVKEME